jgi:hypothetical protein
MPRFKSNRWWALILTLSLGCALVAPLAAPAIADPRMSEESGPGNPGGGSSGDPDLPIGGSKCRLTPRGSAVQSAAGNSTMRVAGDGAQRDGIRTWDLRVVLQGLRLWYIVRF